MTVESLFLVDPRAMCLPILYEKNVTRSSDGEGNAGVEEKRGEREQIFGSFCNVHRDRRVIPREHAELRVKK